MFPGGMNTSSGPTDMRRPVAEVLAGLEIHPLLDGAVPVEALVLVKFLDSCGHPTWALRTTNRLNDEELLGALSVQTELLRRQLVQQWWVDDEDD